MSVCPRCPNCGLANPENLLENLWWCGECGSAWDWIPVNPGFDAEAVSIPRRSQPADELPLPDAEGWWWDFNFKVPGCEVIYVAIINTKPFKVNIDQHLMPPVPPGCYVRCTPPIVQPQPAKFWDSDAEKLLVIFDDDRWTDEDKNLALRIAYRLERQQPKPQQCDAWRKQVDELLSEAAAVGSSQAEAVYAISRAIGILADRLSARWEGE